MRNLPAVLLLLAVLLVDLRAADWPQDGGSAQRGNATAEELPATLALHWTYRAAHAPVPAWPKSDRQPFDRAFHPVIASGTLYFGNSADGKVIALDAATGRERWAFFTGGPVRFAPVAWRDQLFVASDDGHLYCLNAADGKLLWRKRGGPDERMVLGNDRIISQWPARGGPVVADDTVYFAAGIWPSDGIYLYALDAKTGKVLWCNDQAGGIYMPQPHGGANAESGVAAQGNLVVSGDFLLVPTGRAVPAAFHRRDGKFAYFHLQQNGHKGGTTLLAAGTAFANGGLLFDVPTGALRETVGPGALAAFGDGIARSTDKELIVSKFAEKEKTDKKGVTTKVQGLAKLWSLDVPGGAAALTAGKQIVVGAPKQVALVDGTTKKVTWSGAVEGTPLVLAAADGKLYVSTDTGVIHCFGAPTAKSVVMWTKPALPAEDAVMAKAAQEIIAKSGVQQGFCVDLGCGDGSLALELARRTKLHIFAVEADAEKVNAARRKLDAAGLYGVRVTVHQADPALCPYPKYFADLVVSARSIAAGSEAVPVSEVSRLQRPYGGVACLGKTGAMKKDVRGPLEGAGSWTHQYADAANTSCSTDTLVKGPLAMLWFRDSDFEMPQRHGRGPAPLFLDGRLFVEGLNAVRAVDAYNGRPLWEYTLPKILQAYNGEHLMGTAGTGSNLCVSRDGLYLRAGSKCLRLDVATGKLLHEFDAPKLAGGKPGTWGWLACENGQLFGSLVNDEHIVKWRYGKGDMSEQFTESVRVFALDAVTGKLQWTHDAQTSIRHNSLAVGGGKLFLIDRPLALGDRIDAEKDKAPVQPKGELLALDARTGKPAWRTSDNVFGTLLALSVQHDALLMAYQPTAFKLPSEKGGQLAVLRASDGKPLWERTATYATRPLLNGKTIYAQGGAWDLLTGSEKSFDLKRSYGCGQMAGSAHLMLYRSATLGYHDLLNPKATVNYGGIRPGCWINAIPAGGVVLVPDATAGCQCSYLNQAWIALQTRR